MDNFIRYASLYDSFYENKDYAGEVKYISSLISQFNPGARSILDIGCGTGRHAIFFAEAGFQVLGIDRSREMLIHAENRKAEKKVNLNNLHFQEADIRKFRLADKFDVVTALFHVISYQINDNDINSVFANVSNSLDPGGVFIFDFWNGPGVLIDRPGTTIKKAKADQVDITRIAESSLDESTHTVDVTYTINKKNKENDVIEKIIEKHKMRYFFEDELKKWLSENFLEFIGYFEWLTLSRPAEETWNAVMVARKSG